MTVSSARRRTWLPGVAAICAVLLNYSAQAQSKVDDESAQHRRPVKTIAPERMKIKTAQGEAIIAAYTSADMSKQHSEIKRAVIMVHGRLRDADKYFDVAMRGLRGSAVQGETLVIAPQMLTMGDTARHDLSANFPRWKDDSWRTGDMGKAPFPMSSFEVIDGIIAQLVDRSRFPKLERIVLAAHSSGAQFLHRYAVVGHADQVIIAAGLQPYADGVDTSSSASKAPVMRVRFVVANPASYLYFDNSRPLPTAGCKEFDHWHYGIDDPVPYARGADMKALEQRYLTRRVIYLLGGRDVDPDHSALDKSCMAEVQGINRLQRGNYYFAHLLKRASLKGVALRHTRVEVPGVAHESVRMYNSVCGRAALFDTPGCEMKLGESMLAVEK